MRSIWKTNFTTNEQQIPTKCQRAVAEDKANKKHKKKIR